MTMQRAKLSISRADEADPDQEIADDFFGKVGGTVQDVPGKHLVDDQHAHGDQDDRRDGGKQLVHAVPDLGHKFDHAFLPLICWLR